MKRTFLLLAFVASISAAVANPPVSEKIMASFHASFPGVTNVVWTEFENHYQVYFVKDDVHCRVYYDFNGNVVKSRRDYAGEKLNPFLTAKILKRFPDRKIYVVNEIASDQETYFLVYLESEKEWIQLRCDPTGQFNIVAKLKKG